MFFFLVLFNNVAFYLMFNTVFTYIIISNNINTTINKIYLWLKCKEDVVLNITDNDLECNHNTTNRQGWDDPNLLHHIRDCIAVTA